jgi:uncharacterized alpha-E superfamily protein
VLSRVAENVYWLARYLERAENTARLVNVNSNLLLDLPPEYRPGWLALIDMTGSRELFDAREKRAEERDIVHFLIADLYNPGSILSSVGSARENARMLRDVLPNEVWEHMNELFMEIKETLPAALSKRTRFHFLQRIIRGMQTLTGELEGTMSRNDAFTLLMLGRNLERADMTSRIIDVRSAQLLAADAPGFRPFDSIQWLNLLKSLSGYQMYRLSQRTRVSRSAVLEFVLRDLQFPRACLFCLKEVEHFLRALPRSAEVLGSLAEARSFLNDVTLATLDQPGLHELIDRLQLHIIVVHEGIAQTYFPPRAGTSGQSQVQLSSDERPRTPVSSDAPSNLSAACRPDGVPVKPTAPHQPRPG